MPGINVTITEYLLPRIGQQQAVIAEVAEIIDEEVDQQTGRPVRTNKILIAFELAEIEDREIEVNGQKVRPRFVLDLKFFPNLSPKNKLSKLMGSMKGWTIPLTGPQMASIQGALGDPEGKLLGKNCMAKVVHKTSKFGNDRGEIEDLSPLIEGMPEIVVSPYYQPYAERQKRFEEARARRAGQGVGAPVGSSGPNDKDKDDIPF